MLSQARSRDVLRAVIADRDVCQTRVEDANAVLARADILLREAEARLADLARIDDEVAAHMTAAIKSSGSPTLDLPSNLGSSSQGRDEAQDCATAAQAARKTLAKDAETAKSKRDFTLNLR